MRDTFDLISSCTQNPNKNVHNSAEICIGKCKGNNRIETHILYIS